MIMSSNMDYITDTDPADNFGEGSVDESKEQSIKDQVMILDGVKEDIKDLEEQISTLQKRKALLEKETIPNLLQDINATSLTLDDGTTVSYKPDVSVTINDEYTFDRFLEEHVDENLFGKVIKVKRTVGKEKLQQLYNFLRENAIEATHGYDMHHSTKSKFWRDFLLTQDPMEKEQIVKRFASIYYFNKTSVRRKKVSINDVKFSSGRRTFSRRRI